MLLRHHRCVRRQIAPAHPLYGKIVYVPALAEGSVETFCAALRWLGVDARPTPRPGPRTIELGARYTSGDECYPAKITFGDFVAIAQAPDFEAKRTAFLMAGGDGPCRFGQYAPFLKRVLRDLGHYEAEIISPTTRHGYSEFGDFGTPYLRAGWRALVGADLLRKVLLQTRPYELQPGASDDAFRRSIQDFCQTLEHSCSNYDCQLQALEDSLERARLRFISIPVDYGVPRPLIGVVGEIFCRLNTFSNQDLVRKLEKQGAECWLSDIAEWVAYTNADEIQELKLEGRRLSRSMLRAAARRYIQQSDEHKLVELFCDDFAGYEEPSIPLLMELGRPYLPDTSTQGEMVISAGRAVYLARHGADGIIDISPFTCMNGIVSEALYPRISQDHAGIPIRNFYFDGTQSDLDRDVGIYLEIARSYRNRKPYVRRYPGRFGQRAA